MDPLEVPLMFEDALATMMSGEPVLEQILFSRRMLEQPTDVYQDTWFEVLRVEEKAKTLVGSRPGGDLADGAFNVVSARRVQRVEDRLEQAGLTWEPESDASLRQAGGDRPILVGDLRE